MCPHPSEAGEEQELKLSVEVKTFSGGETLVGKGKLFERSSQTR